MTLPDIVTPMFAMFALYFGACAALWFMIFRDGLDHLTASGAL